MGRPLKPIIINEDLVVVDGPAGTVGRPVYVQNNEVEVAPPAGVLVHYVHPVEPYDIVEVDGPDEKDLDEVVEDLIELSEDVDIEEE